jgi:hypothetical protein
MKALILAIILCSATFGQTIHAEHDHLADLEDDIRFKSVIFLNVDTSAIYFKRETKKSLDGPLRRLELFAQQSAVPVD